MADYDYIDQLYKNAGSVGEFDGDGVFKNKKLSQKLAQIESDYNKIEEPKADFMSKLILSFAPAIAGAVGGESAALAAPVAQKQATDLYNEGLKEQKQSADARKKALMDQYNKLSAIGAKQDALEQQGELKRQELESRAEIAKGNQDVRRALAEAALERQKDASAKRAADAEARKKEKIEKSEKLSDKQVEAINDLDSAKSDLQNILDMKTSHNIKTGQIAGRIPEFFSGEDVAAFRSALGRYKDQYRKAITGAGAGPTEIAMLEKRLPNETDQPENFKAKAIEAQKELDRHKSIYLSNLGKQGKKVEQFQNEEPKSGFSDEKAKRLQELRAKAAAGKLGQ